MKRIWRWLALVGLPVLAFAQTSPPANTAFRAPDDKLVVLGSDNDYQLKYDTGNNRMEIRDAAGNVVTSITDLGSTGALGAVRLDIVNGSYATQLTSAATANRAVVFPDAAGTVSLLGSTIESSEITDGTIVNADVSASAAIAVSKLAAGTSGQVLVTSGSTPTWTTVASAGITDGTIVNADISASAAIDLSKLSTSGASTNYVISYNGSAPVWAAAASGSVGGTGPTTDNAIPRMDGTGGVTLQGYSSNTPTINDDGQFLFTNGGTLTGEMSVGNGTDAGYLYMRSPGSIGFYRGAGSTKRGALALTTDTESGSFGGNGLVYQVYDDTGSYSHNAFIVQNNPASGLQLAGIGGVSRDIYLDANGDGTTDSQITAAGKVRLEALAQGGATTGQTLAWNGSTYAPSSGGTGNVSNSGSGTDNRVARFNGDGVTIQDSLVAVEDNGNITLEGSSEDANEITLAVTNPGADYTITVPATTGTLVTTGDTSSVTGTMITNDTVALTTDTTGNYVANVANGSGISGGSAGSEGASLTLSIGALTADWTQSGAFDILLANAGSELKILESAGASFYGTIDVGDLSAHRTYTFPDVGGTVMINGALTADWTQSGAYDVILANASSELKILESSGATYYGIIDAGDLTANRTFTLPDRDSIPAMTTGLVRFGPTDMTPQAYGAVYTACDPYANISGSIIWGMPCLDGVLDAMVMQTIMPEDYNGGTVVVDVYWCTTSSSTNNSQWGCLIGTASAGQDISTATDDYLADPDVGHKVSANAGALTINKVTFSAVSPDHPAAGVPLVVFIGRVADAFFDSGNLDTLAATCYVVGVDVTYTRK